MSVHFNTNPTFGAFRWRSAMCGSFTFAVDTTADPAKVTCGNCKRTIAYKAALASTSEGDDRG